MAAEPKDAQRPPNVILLMADQLRADAVGFMGNGIVQTPHLDRLAAAGTVFEQAYVQTPVCMGSRACIHTGRYPQSVRVRSMGLVPPSETTMAETFRRAGYKTGLFGKLHFTPMGTTLQEFGSEHEIDDAEPFLEAAGIASTSERAAAADPMKKGYGFEMRLGVGDSTWGHYLDWLHDKAPEHDPHHRSENWGMKKEGVGFGTPPANRMFADTVTDCYDSNLPAELHPSAFIAEQTLAFAEANREQPFFAHCSFVDPHHPFNAPIPYNRMYPTEEMPVPPAFDPRACFPPGLAAGVRGQIERTGSSPDAFWQWIRSNYYGMISHLDACVGTLIDGLERLGLADNTLIVFVSDHGEYAGDHRLLYKGSLLFDGVMRVPMVVSMPGRVPSGRRVDAMVQEIDIYPTVMALTGQPVHAGVQGKDLTGLLAGDEERLYDCVSCELDNLQQQHYVATQCVRTERWKLCYYPLEQTGMLFDMQEDPGEYVNRFSDSSCREVRMELTERMLKRLHEAKDPLPIRLTDA